MNFDLSVFFFLGGLTVNFRDADVYLIFKSSNLSIISSFSNPLHDSIHVLIISTVFRSAFNTFIVSDFIISASD